MSQHSNSFGLPNRRGWHGLGSPPEVTWRLAQQNHTLYKGHTNKEQRMSRTIFTFDSQQGLQGWLLEGDGAARATEAGTILVESFPAGTNNPSCTLWSPQPIRGDFHLSFDFRAEGLKGEDVLAWSRSATWDSYAYMKRMRLYTVSYSRGDTGTSGLRKIWAPPFDCPKEQMDPQVSVSRDGCPEMNRWYHVELIKEGSRVRFLNDGQTIHDWTDDGTLGPVLTSGRIGLRSFCKWKKVEYAKVQAVSLDRIRI
jgi:hypothetical protein